MTGTLTAVLDPVGTEVLITCEGAKNAGTPPPTLKKIVVAPAVLNTDLFADEGSTKTQRAKGKRPLPIPTDRVTRSSGTRANFGDDEAGCSSWL